MDHFPSGAPRRRCQRTLLYHLDVALGSQRETEVQLDIANRIGLLTAREYDPLQALTEEVGRMLNGLIDSIERANQLSTSCQLRATS